MTGAEKFSNSIPEILFSYDLFKTRNINLCIERKEKGLYGRIENGCFFPPDQGPFNDIDLTREDVLEELILFLETDAKKK